jgi:hypothetical protein
VGQYSDASFEEFFEATYGRLVGLLQRVAAAALLRLGAPPAPAADRC